MRHHDWELLHLVEVLPAGRVRISVVHDKWVVRPMCTDCADEHEGRPSSAVSFVFFAMVHFHDRRAVKQREDEVYFVKVVVLKREVSK